MFKEFLELLPTLLAGVWHTELVERPAIKDFDVRFFKNVSNLEIFVGFLGVALMLPVIAFNMLMNLVLIAWVVLAAIFTLLTRGLKTVYRKARK